MQDVTPAPLPSAANTGNGGANVVGGSDFSNAGATDGGAGAGGTGGARGGDGILRASTRQQLRDLRPRGTQQVSAFHEVALDMESG